MTTRRARFLLAVLCASAAALAACGHSPTDPGDGTVIALNVETPEVVIGDTIQLNATVRDPNGSAIPDVTVTWTSSDPSIATVSANGLVTAVKMGDANIQVDATIPEVAEVRSIGSWLAGAWSLFEAPVHAAGPRHVTKRVPVHSVPIVIITPSNASIGVGKTQLFTVIATTKSGTPLALLPTTKWSSSNGSVATIGASSGLATSKAEGTTTITVSVDTSTAWFTKGTATLTVSDQCDGLGSVSALSVSLDYDYQKTGKSGDATITSNFHAANLKATVNRDFANAEAGVAQWTGQISGSASQSETKTYPNTPPYTLKDSGPLTRSQMVVTADLKNCTYRITATLFYPVTRTDQTGSSEAGVDVHTGDNPLHKKNDLGSYFGNDAEPEDYPVGTNPVVNGTVFVVSGFAQQIDGDLGTAKVDFFISVSSTNDRLSARKAPPPSLLALVGPTFRKD